jgi:hypothetical protein
VGNVYVGSVFCLICSYVCFHHVILFLENIVKVPEPPIHTNICIKKYLGIVKVMHSSLPCKTVHVIFQHLIKYFGAFCCCSSGVPSRVNRKILRIILPLYSTNNLFVEMYETFFCLSHCICATVYCGTNNVILCKNKISFSCVTKSFVGEISCSANSS